MTSHDIPNIIGNLTKNRSIAQIAFGLMAIMVSSQNGIPLLKIKFGHPFWQWLFGILLIFEIRKSQNMP
jgi:hypothetical protein